MAGAWHNWLVGELTAQGLGRETGSIRRLVKQHAEVLA